MKTFEELVECVHAINEMEQIFKGVVIIACHEEEIRRHKELKDRALEILVKDVHRNDALCSEEAAPDLLEACKKAYSFFPYWYEPETRNFLKQAIIKAKRGE